MESETHEETFSLKLDQIVGAPTSPVRGAECVANSSTPQKMIREITRSVPPAHIDKINFDLPQEPILISSTQKEQDSITDSTDSITDVSAIDLKQYEKSTYYRILLIFRNILFLIFRTKS
eukprot:TRINITY_DN14727_c0_g1_i1.p1 TRINITY_DN14727_c0_g1~~TRINITY_DN14727_c0_g1_i1.p1  ORF type:complete len:120 (+),score=13.07 TRINITY_DN14727_c0_g1_i1:32-391(+)